MKTFNDLTTYNKYLNRSTPLHPLMDSRVCKEAIPNFPQTSGEIQVNLFKISLKKTLPVILTMVIINTILKMG
ncbi:hypothetical protein OWR28_14835 [Chryseobacterium sp. 1B4]